MTMVAAAIWSLGNAFELSAKTLETKVFWLTIEYIGILTLPAFWVAFAVMFTGNRKWLTRSAIALLMLEPILIFGLLLTSRYQNLFVQFDVKPGVGVPLQWDNVNGFFFWLNITYSYCLILFGSIILLIFLSRAKGKTGGGEAVVIVGVLLPWVANVISTFYPIPTMVGLDLTPFALSLTGLAFAWGLFHLRLLDASPGLREIPEDISGWRIGVLDGILRGIFVIWLFALGGAFNNVLDVYQDLKYHYEQPLLTAASIVAIFTATTILLTVITFKRNITYNIRAGIFLFALYALGATGLHNAALSGDGRILFFALIILTAILFDLKASLAVLALCFLTFILIGWMQVKEIVTVPLPIQANAADPAAWLSGGIVLLALSVAALTSITYLLRVLERGMDETQKSLLREKRLTRILRTVSEVNQAILRERDGIVLLQRACEILVDQRGFSYAWVGLLEPDAVTVRKVASAGDAGEPSSELIRIDEVKTKLECRTKHRVIHAPYCVKPAGENICALCPLHAHRDASRSSVAFSLVRNDRPLGYLVILHSSPLGYFETDEIDLLKELSDDLAYALENIYAEEQRQLLSSVTNDLLSARTVDAVWPIIMDSARRALKSDRVAVFHYDSETDRLSCLHSIGLSDGYLAELNRRFHEAPGGRLLFDHEPVVVKDILTDPAVTSLRDWMTREGYRSYAVFPLISAQGLFGALVAYRDVQSVFSDVDISAGQTLAHIFGLAYENLRLYSEASIKAAELGKLYAALQEMTASLLDPSALLKTLVQHMAEAVNVTSSYLVAVNLAEGTLSTLAEYWSNESVEPERKSDEGAVFHAKDYPNIMKAMETAEYLVLQRDDPMLSALEQEQFIEYGIHTMLFVPIIAHGRLLGDIELWESRHRREFTQAEIRLAQAMASQASVAIENARLFTETRQRENELSTMLEVARAVSSSLELSDVLKQAATSMARILRVDDCILSEFDAPGRAINTLARYSYNGEVDSSRDEGVAFRLADYPASEQVMLSGEPVVIRVDDPNADPSEVAYLVKHGYKASLLLPLRVHDSPLGLAELCSFEASRTFQPEEIRLALALADQAAVAIENARLVEAERAQLRLSFTLQQVGATLTAKLGLTDVLDNIFNLLAQVVDFDSVSVQLLKEDGSFELASGRGFPDLRRARQIVREMSDLSAKRQSWQQGLPIAIPDTHADSRWLILPSVEYIRSWIGAPLIVKGKMIGLLNVDSRHVNAYNESIAQTVMAFANQAAIAIENARLFESVQQSEAHFRALIENAAEGVAILDENANFRYLVQKDEPLTGYSYEETFGQSAFNHIHPDDLPQLMSAFKENVQKPGSIVTLEYRLQRKDGKWGYYEVTGHNLLHDPHVQGVVVNYRDITARKLAEAALIESEERYRTIFQSAGVALWEDDYTALFEAIAQLKAEGVTDFKAYLADHPEFLVKAAEVIRVLDVNDAAVKLMGASEKSELLGSLARIFHGPPSQSFINEIAAFAEGIKQFESEVSTVNLLGERREQWITIALPENAGFDRVLVSALDITERKRIESALQESQSRLEAIINTAINAIITINEQQRIVLFNPSAEKVFGYSAAQVLGQPLNLLVPERFRSIHEGNVMRYGQTGESSRNNGILDHLFGVRSDGEEFPMEAYISHTQVNGKRYFTVILQDITERKRSEGALRSRAAELESLVAVSTSLRASSTVAEMIPVILREAAKVCHAANGSIFLLEQSSGDLVSRGWYSAEKDSFIQLADVNIVRHTIYEGVTGFVARTGQVYSSDHLQEDPLPVFVAGEAERLEGMNSGISLPLRAHDSVVGVLHVALREKRSFTETEVRLLTAIAEMAGNALQRAALLEKTLQQARDLSAAYDNTLAGWARALELRDELTEGHTRRVTALTVELAQAMGIPAEDIVQIQRGAILHDIGKMGIPDEILLKRASLTPEEFAVMRQHPSFAFEMLYPITFLRPALDIPYCHHEKWDGSGYPRGLKGEEIPLAARIFAVADVWDAVTSDRPYRPAWPRKKALDYLRSESGKYFDPRVLDVFFSLKGK